MTGASIQLELLRAEDHLILRFEGLNLTPSSADPTQLTPIDPNRDSQVIFTFPPQSIAEETWPEGSPAKPVGEAASRISGDSRLVFRLPPGTDIPATFEGLLNWNGLEPILNRAAAAAPGLAPDPIPTTVSAPGPAETAVELPYRLIVSPGPDARFDCEVLPETRDTVTTVWHARLVRPVLSDANATGPADDVRPGNEASLRVVWSPDYIGPVAARPPSDPQDEPPGFPTVMTADDRHQITLLESGYTSFHRYPASRLLWRQPPAYVPGPGTADRFSLSALGGSLRQHAAWTSPEYPELPFDASGTQVTVSAWAHTATFGRDHLVTVQHDGVLYPLGHRATSVTVYERRFETLDEPSAPPTARLRTYQFVILREPTRPYPADAYAYEGREMPFTEISLAPTVTPHLHEVPVLGTNSVWLNLEPDGARPFWFDALGRDRDGSTIRFSAHLLFVPNEDRTGPAAGDRLRAVDQAYQQADRTWPTDCGDLAFAPSSNAGLRDGTLTTVTLQFGVQNVGSASFRPWVQQATVRNAAAEAFLGPGATADIGFYQPYLDHGFDEAAEVFAAFLSGPKDVAFPADRAGGLASPVPSFVGFGRVGGVIAGSLDQAAAGQVSADLAFPSPDATLLGTVSLQDLLGPGLLPSAQAPQLQTSVETSADGHRRAVTTMAFQTPVRSAGLLTPRTDGAALQIQARIERDLAATGDEGQPPNMTVAGSITSVTVALADVIALSFDSITFGSKTGQQPNVAVALAAQDPVVFEGPLSFVNALADILPAGMFGADGPSLDISPTGLEVGYSLALPSLSVGVFSLEHIALGATFTLPFLTGKPVLDLSFATRDHPFLLTVSLFGGGGFVHVKVDPSGPIAIEGSLEFGGEFALDIGVASGGVSIMAGIYFHLSQTISELVGFVDIHGEVTVLSLVSVSVDFNLQLGYLDGKAYGRADMTVSVEVACFSKSVTLSVERSFGGSSGDPRFVVLATPEQWSHYAAAFA